MRASLNGKILFRTIALSFVGMLGFAADSLGGHTQEMRTLDTAELRVLLRNASMSAVTDPNFRGGHPEVEKYYERGEYVRLGGRASHSGTFTIEDGRVCVQLSLTGGPECYRLQRDREGHIWKVDARDHSRIRVTIVLGGDL